MQSSKLLIFGGTFNPFHNGHYEILKQAEQLINPDKILIIPNYISPEKQNTSYISDIDRINMIKLGIEHEPNWEICEYEINQKQISYTINTINYLINEYKDYEIYLLIGADQWIKFNTWKDCKKILNLVKIVVADRDNLLDLNNNFYDEFIKINGIKNNISSSIIRQEPSPYLLNKNVLNYINDNAIYAIDRIKPLMSDKRFSHSLRVANMAKDLMNKHCPELSNLAFTVGIYHDICKEMDYEEQINISKNILKISKYDHVKVLHGYVGSYLLRSKYWFNNQLVLNAISRHTKPFDYYTNEPNILDKVLYLADKLEPNRMNDDVFGQDINEWRKFAYEDLDKCFIELYNWLQLNINK